jgi:hypothetical protein
MALQKRLEIATGAQLLPQFLVEIASCARYPRRWDPSARSYLACACVFGQGLEMVTTQSEGSVCDEEKRLDQLVGVVLPGKSIEWY